MEIRILQLIEGAKRARGLAVIIDVFRAFSTACYAFSRGVNRIIPVGDLELAYSLKEENIDYILMGERQGKILPGFDFGNSPTHILEADLTAKTVVHTTSAGTQGIVNAARADEIITASFVNAAAVIEYIRKKNPAVVSLVSMGNACEYEAEEDTLCAQYLKNALEGKPCLTRSEIKETLQRYAGQRFFELASQSWSPENDFYLCTDLNRFNFVLKAEKKKEGYYQLQKADT
ncbi:2-phosphosulfolactate phosphatase [Halocella sp. SP3-1]|uniref:2-phosphosulfolactate phosphatase n=1 Tax=Halocella sp. SP3-1 TaxID=2382161 RepID=UPI000F758CC4|nr:2-phosphosulfolactate phosphatase [Halocella sp. SP3-1]AZO96405.1 2-phosphosulfolactate phosphatase [Halocella sp. SP3-1]